MSFTALLMTLACVTSTSSLNYLLIPMMSVSHILRLGAVGNGLADRGHKVYMIKHNSIPIPLQLRHSKIHFLDYSTGEAVHFISTKNCSEMYYTMENEPAKAVPKLLDFFDQQCHDLLENEDLFKMLEKLNLDFAVVDAFSALQCFFAYPRRLGIPYAGLGLLPPLENFQTTLQFNFVTPTLPIAMNSYPQTPSLKHRLRQWLTINIMSLIVEYRQNNEVLAKFLKNRPLVRFSDLRRETKLWIVDSHPIVDVAKPSVPNVVYIGGLTTGKAKPLPADLQAFADSAQDGLIIVSFGTVVTHIPEYEFRYILTALNNITSQKAVVIATPMRIPITLRSHIIVKKWVPQNDLLAHPNTRLFITHCGSSSQHEAIYHGVPMLAIPFQEEQKANAQRMQAKGFGLHIDRNELTVQKIISAITNLENNHRIRQAVKQASIIMKDRFMEPGAEAAYWLQHVAKFGNEHLTSYTERLAWYEALMIDMMAVAILLVCAPILFLYFLCKMTKRIHKMSKFKQA